MGARVRLLGRPGESEGCARVSEGWLAKKVVAWAYEPITDSRISPPMHTRVLMISARVARESAKMHLRNMGCAWSSSIDFDRYPRGLLGFLEDLKRAAWGGPSPDARVVYTRFDLLDDIL